MSRITPRLLLGWALCALAHAPVFSQPTPAPADSARAEPASEPVQNSDLSAELLYLLLVGEIQAQTARDGTQLREAFQLLLEAAVQTRDERLFERATRLAIQSRAGSAALQTARAWKSAHPLSVNANTMHFDILVSLNRLPESFEALRQALRVMNASEQAAMIEGLPETYALAREKAQVVQQVERVLQPASQAPSLAATSWVSIGRLRLWANDPAGALDAARMAASLDVQSDKPILLAVDLIAPDRPMAEVMVKNHLSTRPQDTELRFAYARTLLQFNQPARVAQAQALMREVIALRPQWPTPHLILGTLAHERNNLVQATDSIEHYLRLSEALPTQERERGRIQAHLVLSSIALKQNDFERALYWLDRIDNPPDPLTLSIQRATIVAKQGLLDDALALLAPAPTDTPVLVRRKVMAQSQLLRDAQQHAKAFDRIAQVRAQGNAEPDLLYEQAMLAEKLQRYDTMEKLLRELMVLKPHDASAYNALGFFLADQNLRLDEAKALIEKALALSPDDPFITDSLGWVEFRLGNLARAQALLEKALQTRADAEIAAHLGEVYWRMGQPDKARQMWQRALQLDSKNETLQQTIRRLDRKP